MGVLDGTPVNAATTNPAFINKNINDTMSNILGFNRGGSGTSIADIQAAVNRLYTASGASESTTGTVYNATPGTITNGQNYQTALNELAGKFDPATGHFHTGAAGDGPLLNVVRSLAASGYSALTGALVIQAGSGVSVTEFGQTINIAATGGVQSVAASGYSALTGAIVFQAGSGMSITESGQDIIFAATGSAAGVSSIAASGFSPLTGNVIIQAGSGISVTESGQDIIISKNAPIAPTTQIFSQTGYYTFTITTSTPTWAAGDVYTNNSSSFTTVYAETVSGATTFVAYRSSGTNAPLASGTLTRSSGSGTSSLAYSSVAANGTYFLPTANTPIYIRVRMVGGGGGGAGSGFSSVSVAAGAGGAGGATTFGSSLLSAGAGSGGSATGTNPGGAGGSASLGSGPTGLAIAGSSGQGGPLSQASLTTAGMSGGNGGSSALGGAGGGGYYQGAGSAAATNSGSGGGGGGVFGNSGGQTIGGGGGGAGGFVDALITSPSASYPFNVAVGGTAGTAGSNGFAGASGGSGVIMIEEMYQ